MKFFTFGDGYATGHIWPEWPQILQALLPNYEVVNTAGIGAGPEFLVSSLVDMLPQLRNQTIIFQWPYAKRFDKLVEDGSWQEIISQDPTYHFNTVIDRKNQTWWLSSASQQPMVQQYHREYVQARQHQNRLETYKILVSAALESANCQFTFTSTQEQEKYSRQARFGATRQQEVQPSPWVHFCWLVEEILPRLNIAPKQTRQQRLSDLIQNQTWKPYDADRAEIWQHLLKSLNG
jgi:hypothetical protein